jgi:hypothetical protein
MAHGFWITSFVDDGVEGLMRSFSVVIPSEDAADRVGRGADFSVRLSFLGWRRADSVMGTESIETSDWTGYTRLCVRDIRLQAPEKCLGMML